MLCLKEFFYDPDGDTDEIDPYKRIGNGCPLCNRDPGLETYIKAIRDNILQSLVQDSKYRPNDNLTSQERKSLLSLRSRLDIIIKPADKGSAIVVMSSQYYFARVMSHIHTESFHCKLDDIPAEWYAKDITSFIVNIMDRQGIDKGMFNHLRPQNPQTSWFYIFPKSQTRKSGKTNILLL